jgi:hypothetical protein
MDRAGGRTGLLSGDREPRRGQSLGGQTCDPVAVPDASPTIFKITAPAARHPTLVKFFGIGDSVKDPAAGEVFPQAAAVGAAAVPALDAAPKLPTRTPGKTGIKVSILGFGSGSRFLMYQEEVKALTALSRALDLGVIYIDTARAKQVNKSHIYVIM